MPEDRSSPALADARASSLADGRASFASRGQTSDCWRFERDPFFALVLKDRAVSADARTVLEAWASQHSLRRFEVLSADGGTALTAALVSHVTDTSAMSDLGHLVVRQGLMRHRHRP